MYILSIFGFSKACSRTEPIRSVRYTPPPLTPINPQVLWAVEGDDGVLRLSAHLAAAEIRRSHRAPGDVIGDPRPGGRRFYPSPFCLTFFAFLLRGGGGDGV